jgi:hypothetical protein
MTTPETNIVTLDCGCIVTQTVITTSEVAFTKMTMLACKPDCREYVQATELARQFKVDFTGSVRT